LLAAQDSLEYVEFEISGRDDDVVVQKFFASEWYLPSAKKVIVHNRYAYWIERKHFDDHVPGTTSVEMID